MNQTELIYSLASFILLGLSAYAVYLSKMIFGIPLAIPLAIIGILLGIRSTNAQKPKWMVGVLVSIIAIILGYFAFIFLFKF